MRKQINHLAEMAELPNIIIQILPYSMNSHPGLNGPLTILEFSDSTPMAYAEGWGSGRLIENAADVATFIACYDLIRASALPQGLSIAKIREVGGSK